MLIMSITVFYIIYRKHRIKGIIGTSWMLLLRFIHATSPSKIMGILEGGFERGRNLKYVELRGQIEMLPGSTIP